MNMFDRIKAATGDGAADTKAVAGRMASAAWGGASGAAGSAGGGELLRVQDLHVEFPGELATVRAASNVCFCVGRGQTLGIVGESGCGKSVTLRALCGLVPEPGRVRAGKVCFDGVEYQAGDELAKLRGEKISMIFQDPASSLNPVLSVGTHLSEVLRVKLGYSRKAARTEAIELLGHVGIPDPAKRLSSYPHELSGGMRQRVMIAMAIAVRPQVLLADEPTTALDVTTQEQILKLLLRLQAESGMAIILVTHDLGVIEEICDEVVVMYAGYVLERLTVDGLADARHPYTRGLIAAMPQIDAHSMPAAILGQPPSLAELPPGCPFAPRCPEARTQCTSIDMHRLTVTECACPFNAPENRGAAGVELEHATANLDVAARAEGSRA
jgi:oligopeptide/dipeptide ABC transporter ATP-binding protein